MSKVKIIPDENGNKVRSYVSNDEFAYIQLETTNLTASGGWVQNNKRNCLLRAKKDVLQQFVAANPNGLPGKILIREYLENEVPANVQNENFNKKLEDYESQIKNFIKIKPTDKSELTKDGQRILRFASWDATGLENDILVQHDVVANTAPRKSVLTPNEEFVAGLDGGEEDAL